jgi:Ribbon-helix-helix protein, copG family.
MSVQVKISEEVYNKVKEIAEKSGKSIREVVEEAINIYLLGKSDAIDKDVKSVKEKWIVAKFQSKCAKCGKSINQGDMVFWVHIEYADNSKRSIVFCTECYYTSIDTALAKKYLRAKELEAIIRGLKKEADRLAEEVKQLEQKVNLLKVEREIEEFWFAFRTTFGSSPESTILRNFLDKLEDLINKVREIEALQLGVRTQTENILRKRVRNPNQIKEW